MYETRLREVNPMAQSITYDIKSLFMYLDDMKEIVALVCVHSHMMMPLLP